MGERLDDRLAAERDDLRRRIRVPELSIVTARAGRLRRRRRRLAIGSAALALLTVVGLGAAVTRDGSAGGGLDRVGEPGDTVSQWQGDGISVRGLDGVVLDLSGSIVDVEFAGDGQRGYALASQCEPTGGPCDFTLAATVDRGHTWSPWAIPGQLDGSAALPSLLAVGDGVYVGDGEHGAFWFARYPRTDWTYVSRLSPPSHVDTVPPGARLMSTKDGCGRDLYVLRPDGGLSDLTPVPPMSVCTVASGPTADGAWWIAGRSAEGDKPAVGVSHDGGATWTISVLPGGGPGVTTQVQALGDRVFATVLNPMESGAQLASAVYRSVDGGPFTLYARPGGGLIGELVPLLDGRLVGAGPDWRVFPVGGNSFRPAAGGLPWVGEFRRTPGGWIAYNLFRAGWVAQSTDGLTWQKLNVH